MFFHNRQILDALGVAQEGMHTIKVKKLDVIILKHDLAKAYDIVDWTFFEASSLKNWVSLEVTN